MTAYKNVDQTLLWWNLDSLCASGVMLYTINICAYLKWIYRHSLSFLYIWMPETDTTTDTVQSMVYAGANNVMARISYKLVGVLHIFFYIVRSGNKMSNNSLDTAMASCTITSFLPTTVRERKYPWVDNMTQRQKNIFEDERDPYTSGALLA